MVLRAIPGVTPETPPEPVTPVAADGESLWGPALRMQSPIFAVEANELRQLTVGQQEAFDPAFNPWAEIQGTPLESYWERFADAAQTRAQFDAIRANIEREERDRARLDAAGWTGFWYELGASVVSPTSLISVGAGAARSLVTGGARTVGGRIGQAATAGAIAAPIDAAIDEAILQSQQETRTAAETIAGIAFAPVAGAVLGAAGGGAVELVRGSSGAPNVEAMRPPGTQEGDPVRRPGASVAMKEAFGSARGGGRAGGGHARGDPARRR